MSVSKWMYDPEKCEGVPCPGDCEVCWYWRNWEDEEGTESED